MLEFEVKNQKLERIDVVEPATDSQQYLKAKFTIKDADWNEKAKTAYFRLGAVVYKALLDNNNMCIVPSEVLIRSESKYARTQGSKIFVSLVGEYSTTRITTNEVCVVLNTSGYSDALTPETPTENEYQQIITQYANNEAAINEAKAECETARADLVGVKNIFANGIKGNLSGAVVSADDVSPVEHEPIVKVHGKNLLKHNLETATNHGVEFKSNADGSITINGTAANESYYTFAFGTEILYHEKEMIASLVGGNGQVGFVVGYFKADGSVENSIAYCVDDELSFVFPKEAIKTRIYLVVGKGKTFENQTIYPMIRMAGTTSEYEPYIDPSTAKVARCGKNLVRYPYSEDDRTRAGITYTITEDGMIVYDGTSTGSYISLSTFEDENLYLREGVTYTFSGMPSGSSMKTAYAHITENDGTTRHFLAEGQTTFKASSNGFAKMTLVVSEGTSVTKQIFKPMLEVGENATPFEAYKSASFTPSAVGKVEGITSLSPNMTILTDTEGAVVECEYIKDTNKVIQKIADALNITI